MKNLFLILALFFITSCEKDTVEPLSLTETKTQTTSPTLNLPYDYYLIVDTDTLSMDSEHLAFSLDTNLTAKCQYTTVFTDIEFQYTTLTVPTDTTMSIYIVLEFTDSSKPHNICGYPVKNLILKISDIKLTDSLTVIPQQTLYSNTDSTNLTLRTTHILGDPSVNVVSTNNQSFTVTQDEYYVYVQATNILCQGLTSFYKDRTISFSLRLNKPYKIIY